MKEKEYIDSLAYYAFISKDAPGVTKKIINFVKAANEIKVHSEYKLFFLNIKGILRFFYSLLHESSNIIIIRNSNLLSVFIFFACLYHRVLNKKKIVIDVPTPKYMVRKELETTVMSTSLRTLKILSLYVFGSWVLLPANKILYYSNESRYFSLGIKRKIVLMGNGILIDGNLPLCTSVWPNSQLNLIGVALISYWHGYDRVIKAIKNLNNMNLDYRITFTIVGEGPELDNLRILSKELGLEDNICFTGLKKGNELNKIFQNMHIGISSIGLYRKGCNLAADLKSREYLARGIPIISSVDDPDIDGNCPYVFRISNNDNIDDLVNIFRNFKSYAYPNHLEIRKYAIKCFSMQDKVRKIIFLLNNQ